MDAQLPGELTIEVLGGMEGLVEISNIVGEICGIKQDLFKIPTLEGFGQLLKGPLTCPQNGSVLLNCFLPQATHQPVVVQVDIGKRKLSIEFQINEMARGLLRILILPVIRAHGLLNNRAAVFCKQLLETPLQVVHGPVGDPSMPGRTPGQTLSCEKNEGAKKKEKRSSALQTICN